MKKNFDEFVVENEKLIDNWYNDISFINNFIEVARPLLNENE